MKIDALVTTISKSTGRITMHGVRKELLQAQAKALGLPLYLVELGEDGGMQAYEGAISQMNQKLKSEGFTHAISGDLFLEDLKAYREALYAKDGIECSFPLWQVPCHQLLDTLLSEGFKAITVAVNGSMLGKEFCGRLLDASFISDLPAGVDPCGENGEYHSFVFDGPGFAQPVVFKKGGLHPKTYPAPRSEDDCFREAQGTVTFWFCELEEQ